MTSVLAAEKAKNFVETGAWMMEMSSYDWEKKIKDGGPSLYARIEEVKNEERRKKWGH